MPSQQDILRETRNAEAAEGVCWERDASGGRVAGVANRQVHQLMQGECGRLEDKIAQRCEGISETTSESKVTNQRRGKQG